MHPLGAIGSIVALAGLMAACSVIQSPSTRAPSDPPRSEARGAEIYSSQCVQCHGPMGQGVAGHADEPLYGEKSIEALARYIERNMPEDRPGTCTGPDAMDVAKYIHETFYSASARARGSAVRIELARLTNRQYRESVADLIGGFVPSKTASEPGGLLAEYYQSEGMNKKHKRVLQRQDAVVDFDFGTNGPTEGISADQFSIAWNGSLLAQETGEYGFRLSTPNGARLYLNTDLAAGDANLRDDSGARRQPATIDLWVSSGGKNREEEIRMFLLGGRSYPLRVDYFKFKEKTAAIRFEWKPPHGPWAVVPPEALSPEASNSQAVVGTAFPADDGSLGYERGTSVSKEWHEATTRAAMETAAAVEARLARISGVRDNVTNRVERLRQFCSEFAGRAFRRPLSPDLRSVYIEGQFAEGVAPELAVKRAVLLVLKSPRFLYPDWEGLDDHHAVAGRLALALWDSLPDEGLREAAARGELGDAAQVRSQARRMLGDPRARAKLSGFFHHWLGLEEAEDLSKDPKAYPGFGQELVGDLRRSLERFLDEVVWSDRSDYRELLTADYLYLNARLAAFYGAVVPADGGFERVHFDPAQRAGVFTHPLLLAALSYHRSSSPIHRGVFLTRNVLGRFLKPPPMAIEFMDDRFDPSLTMREKVTELTGKPACMACHVTINPLGFSLEHYDAAGRYRTEDNGKKVDAVSEYTTSDGKTVTLRGPRDLAEHAVGSAEARKGFVRQLFQHTLKQTPAAYAGDTLNRLTADFEAGGCHIRDLVVEISVVGALRRAPSGGRDAVSTAAAAGAEWKPDPEAH